MKPSRPETRIPLTLKPEPFTLKPDPLIGGLRAGLDRARPRSPLLLFEGRRGTRAAHHRPP